MQPVKDVLTTGQVAKICNVAPRTVSKWFDSGKLSGYRIPGSKDRRIPMNALIRFMKQHHIPLDGLQSGRTRVLIVDREIDLADQIAQTLSEQANYEVRTVGSGFSAGVECEKFRPHAMVLDVHLPDVRAEDLCAHLQGNPDLQLTRVIGTSDRLTEGQMRQLTRQGFDAFCRKPLTVRQIIDAVEQATAVVY